MALKSRSNCAARLTVTVPIGGEADFILSHGTDNWNSAVHLFYTSDSGIDRRIHFMAIALAITQATVQIVAGVGAVILVALAIMRHKSRSKKEADDEF